MFTAKLCCRDCKYETEEFVNGYSPDTDCLTFVYQNMNTKKIRFVFAESLGEVDVSIERKYAEQFCGEDEKFIVTYLQKETAAVCPECGKNLFVETTGII